MKNNLKVIAAFAALPFIFSCNNQNIDPVNPDAPDNSDSEQYFTATIESPSSDTKTTLQPNDAVWWKQGDEILVNGKRFVAESSGNSSRFLVYDEVAKPYQDAPHFKAYYPTYLVDGDKTVLPKEQDYVEGEICNLPMYTESDNQNLVFRNICAMIEINLRGDAKVKRVIVSADNASFCGEFTVEKDGDGFKAVLTDEAMAARQAAVLDCTNAGVQLTADGKVFRIAVPAGTYDGFTITAINTEDKACAMKATQTVTIARNTIYAFDKTPVFEDIPNYFRFTALWDKVILCNNSNESNLVYSTDWGISWADIPYSMNDPVVFDKAGDEVFVRAKSKGEPYMNFTFSDAYMPDAYPGREFAEKPWADVSGNIMYLVDPTGEERTLSGRGFKDMFSTSMLGSAAHLVMPATKLSAGCYENMFNNSSLTEAPAELPATELAENCYRRMFSRCLSLKASPKMLADTMAVNCCQQMFYGCDNLAEAPALPATKLASGCYDNMFQECVSLKVAPELPATEVAEYCYTDMFYDCTALTAAPALKAKSMEYYCYAGMFCGCTSLATASELPAMSLAEDCYSGMYKGCTSLVKAPVLPAYDLPANCYKEMFYGCSALNFVQCMGVAKNSGSLDNWLNGVSTTGTFIRPESSIEYETGASGIPAGWTVEKIIREASIGDTYSRTNPDWGI